MSRTGCRRRGATSRRVWMGQAASTLFALGAWPGHLRAADNGQGEDFAFLVVNDLHCQSAKCEAWLERVVAQMRRHEPRPAFCLAVGDLAEHGTAAELGPVRDHFAALGVPPYWVPGNHDYASATDRSAYETLFRDRINYHFEHRGWQFVGLDSTDGIAYENTRVPNATLRWLDETLPRLDRARPTVAFTHFPLGAGVPMRPRNADALLERFLDFNLVAVFNGHFHGFTERLRGHTTLTTNRCCAQSRANHDGTPQKGYFLCHTRAGGLQRQFIEVALAVTGSPG